MFEMQMESKLLCFVFQPRVSRRVWSTGAAWASTAAWCTCTPRSGRTTAPSAASGSSTPTGATSPSRSAPSPWNNGKEVPRWGVVRYRKWVPQQLGDVNKQGSGGQPTNRSVARRQGIQSHWFAVQVWSTVCICSPGVVELVRSNLAPDFPLFHVGNPQIPTKLE